MRISVKLFGAEALAAGAAEAVIDLDMPATCAELRKAMRAQAPALAASLDWARFAVNGRYASDDEPIGPGDELALIGLVSGG